MMKIYPSKRVKNHAAKKLKKVYELKGRVILKHAKSIKFPEDKHPCMGLCYSETKDNGKIVHRIILAEDLNDTESFYLGTLAHEYAHAWQYENDMPLQHNEISGFLKWQRYWGARAGIYI